MRTTRCTMSGSQPTGYGPHGVSEFSSPCSAVRALHVCTPSKVVSSHCFIARLVVRADRVIEAGEQHGAYLEPWASQVHGGYNATHHSAVIFSDYSEAQG